MGLKSENREIGGVSVTSTQLPAMKSYALFGRLIRLASPVLGSLAGSSMTDGKGDPDAMMSALGGLFEQLDEKSAEELALKILSSTQVKLEGEDGQPAKILSLNSSAAIDAAFPGQLMTMLGAMKFAIEVNFGDFIATALAAARARKAKAEAAKAKTMAVASTPD